MSTLTLQDLLFDNKLFDITKAFKEFEFQEHLQIEFTKNDEVLKDPWFDSEKIEFNDKVQIEILLDFSRILWKK